MLPLTNAQITAMLKSYSYTLLDDGTLYNYSEGTSIRPDALNLPDVSKYREAIGCVYEAVRGMQEAERKRVDSNYTDERAASDAYSWSSTLGGYRLMLKATMPPLTAIAILHTGHMQANGGA